MKTHFRKLWDSLTTSYWFVPVLMMLLALLLWCGTKTLDYQLSSGDKKAVAWLYLSDADTMRTLLLTIAVAIIGVVGVVFTIIMVPLTIAAAQFGPRLLRTFLRDTGTQVTLGIFNATFIFCMAVLLQLSGTDKRPLPQLSVNVALLLGLVSFGVLIYFINHIAVSLQAPIVVARVSKELHTAINHDLPDLPRSVSPIAAGHAGRPPVPAEAELHSQILASHSGYVQLRDDISLLRLAQQQKIICKLLYEPGDFVVQGTPLAMIWPQKDSNKVSKAMHEAFVLGPQRTLVQDVTFGINELVEVALRALSPAINDPFTAITCLHWIGAALVQVCSRTFPSPFLFDKSGELRIIRNPFTFTQLADAAFSQIREYGRTSQAVTLRLMNTIGVVATAAQTAEQRTALLHHANLTESSSQIGLPQAPDRQPISSEFQRIKKQLENSGK